MFFETDKFAKRLTEFMPYRWADMQSLGWFYVMEGQLGTDEVYTECPVDFPEDTIRLGEEFVGRDRYVWLRRQIDVPAEKEGFTPVARFDFGKTGINNKFGFESLLYINGHPYQGVDGNHQEVILTPFAGQRVTLTFLLWSGLEGGGPKTPQYHRLQTAQVGYLDKNIDKLYYLFKNALDVVKWLPEDNTDKLEMQNALAHTCQLLDFDQDQIRETAAEALSYLEKALAAMPNNSPVTVWFTGHSHIDVTWLWRLKHTREKTQRSFSTVLRLMEEYPEYRFLQTQPQLYKFIKKDNPELYERIKQRVAEGRWEVDGGMWLEADCNLTSGESLTRQFLYGIRFIEEEFGKKCTYLWLPDVFGYSWALPQIMKLCDLDTFMTTKISWNEYNAMPNDLFWWRGIDGTNILTYFVNGPNNTERSLNVGKVSNYSTEIAPLVAIGAWKRFKNKELTRDVLISYGFGDGGGGPARYMLDNLRAMQQIPGLPQVKAGAPAEFFQKLHKTIDNTERYVPVWDGELYLELHRGTYTTEGMNKWHNRKLEYALTSLEWLSVLAMLRGGEYDAQSIHNCWEQVLCAQFHDTIPGSSIREVYEDTDKIYASVWSDVERMNKSACDVLMQPAKDQWSVLRFADTCASESVFIPETADGVFTDADGNTLSAQKTADGWLVEKAWKPLAIEQVRFTQKALEQAQSVFALDMENRCLDTPFYRIVWEESGALISLWDKENGREVLNGKGNVLRVYEDRPRAHDAWDIDIFHTEKFEDAKAQSVCCTEDGPVRMRLKFTYSYRASRIEQEMVVYGNNRRIDFETHVDWHEDHRLLRTLFDVDVRSTKATYDVQFGHVERPTHWNTSWDWAKFEVCGHKWADLSETGYGVSLLNDCKYGYSVKDTVMGLSLLKSPKYPDTEADMGEHTFTYALLPHTGNLGAETIEQGISLNQPAVCVPGASAAPVGAFLKKDSGSVKVDAIKPAEDGNGFVVHLHECLGGRAKVTLTSDYPIQAYAPCNLLEEYDEKITDAEIHAEFRPFEIKCFRIWNSKLIEGEKW